MSAFYFYLGNGYYEFERPEIVVDPGAKANISVDKYKLSILGSVKRGDSLEYIIKQNDTLPVLEAQLLNEDGTPINLVLCGVHFHMKTLDGKKLINRPAEIIDNEAGKVKVAWQEGDTSKVGLYKCEFEIVFTDSTVLTIPNDGYFFVRIVNEIA